MTVTLTIISILLIIFLGIMGFYFYLFVSPFLSLWFKAFVCKADVKLIDLARMRLEEVPPEQIKNIVDSSIMAAKAGIDLDPQKLNAHRHAGGNVSKVVQAMITAHKSKIPLSYSLATKIDLAKLDVVKAVQMCVIPVVREAPVVTAKAKDGIEVIVKCQVTMKANLENYIGGADQSAVLGRVSEGIGAAVGMANIYQDIIENPFQITEYIMSIDRDGDGIPDVHENTAYIVMSIDVSDIDLGENIAAKLESEQAEADAKQAQAEAEERRGALTQREEQLKQQLDEMRAKLIEAEAEVPLALAGAIREGRFEKQKNKKGDSST